MGCNSTPQMSRLTMCSIVFLVILAMDPASFAEGHVADLVVPETFESISDSQIPAAKQVVGSSGQTAEVTELLEAETSSYLANLAMTEVPDSLPLSTSTTLSMDAFKDNLAAAKAYSELASAKIVELSRDHEHFLGSAKHFFLGFAKAGYDEDEITMIKEIKDRRAGANEDDEESEDAEENSNDDDDFVQTDQTAISKLPRLSETLMEVPLVFPRLDLEEQYKAVMDDVWTKNKGVWGTGSLGPYILKAIDTAMYHDSRGVLFTKDVPALDDEGEETDKIRRVVLPTTDSFGMQDFEPRELAKIGASFTDFSSKFHAMKGVRYLKKDKLKEEIITLYQKYYGADAIIPNAAQDRKDQEALEAAEAKARITPSPTATPEPVLGEKISIVLQVATAAGNNTAGGMRPNVTFITTTNEQWGPYEMLGVPKPGGDDLLSFCTEQDESLLAQFGDVKEIWLESGSSATWHFSEVKARVTGADSWVTFEDDKWLGANESSEKPLLRSEWHLGIKPDTASPTEAPTSAPTTGTPTTTPTTQTPTSAPTTQTPTSAPTTQTPTSAPTTQTPTSAPTTQSPTGAPTTLAPTGAPTTMAPTAAPTKAWTVSIKMDTGGTPEDAEAGAVQPQVTLVGETGSETFTLTPGAVGNKATITERIGIIGALQAVELTATSATPWYFTEFLVKVNNTAWVPFGSCHQYLMQTDATTRNGHPAAAKITLHPEDLTLVLKATTGEDLGYQASTKVVNGSKTARPLVVVQGTKARKVFQINTLAGKSAEPVNTCPDTCLGGAGNVRVKMCSSCKCSGCAKELWNENCKATVRPEPCPEDAGDKFIETSVSTVDLGEIKSVQLLAQDDVAWYMDSVQVKMGKTGKYAAFGPLPALLDKKNEAVHFLGVPVASSFVLKPTPHELWLSVTTGDRATAGSQGFPHATIYGDKGSYSTQFSIGDGKPGAVATTKVMTTEIGHVQKVVFNAVSKDSWLFTNVDVKTDAMVDGYMGFGPTYQWLQAKPFNKDVAVYDGRHFNDTVTLSPRKYTTIISVTTAQYYKSESKASIEMVLHGSEGDSSALTLSELPNQGETKIYNFTTVGLGNIQAMHLSSESTDGYMFQAIKVQQGLGRKYIEFGPGHQWVVAPPYKSHEWYSDFPHAQHVKLTPAQRKFYLKYSTGEMQGDATEQKPRVDFIGTKDNNTFNLDSIPLKGQEDEKMFMLTDIGQLLGVLFTAEDGKPWLVKDIAYREVKTQKDPNRKQDTTAGQSDLYHYHDEHEMLYAPLPEVIQKEEKNKDDALDLTLTDEDFIETASGIGSVDEAAAHEGGDDDNAGFIRLGSEGWLVENLKDTPKDGFGHYPAEKQQLARPEGTNCHCTGEEVEVPEKETKYGETKIGGYCGYHFATDNKAWCHVEATCSGRKLSSVKESLLWFYCTPPLVPAEITIRPSSNNLPEGQLSISVWGMDGKGSLMQDIDMSLFKKPKVAVKIRVMVPEEVKDIDKIGIQYTDGSEKFQFDLLHAQYGGGFVHAYSTEKDVGKDTIFCGHIPPQPTGSAKVWVSAANAKNVQTIRNADYTLITPSQLGMSAAVIIQKLHDMRKEILDATSAEFDATPDQQSREIKRVVMSMGGEVADGTTPLGFQTASTKNTEWAQFNKVDENTDHIALIFSPGFLFTYEEIKSGATNSLTKKRSIMAPTMKKGQMTVVLTWGEWPSDLDLWVMAPAKRNGGRNAEIGGGATKPDGHNFQDDFNSQTGPPVNWMNTGNPKVYPYVVLDVDDMSAYGPETMTVHKPVTGAYKIYVECYSCWSSSSYAKFKSTSGAKVRIFDRYGLRHELNVADAKGEPNKVWNVGERQCRPPLPLEGQSELQVGSADRDNRWNLVTNGEFTSKMPAL